MEPPKIQSNKEKALSVHDYLLDNLGNPGLGNLQALSNRFFITPKTLTREFKRQFHVTVRVFIKEERLKRAYQLLVEQEGTVTEVAIHVGFTNAGNFSREFKKKYNLTPGSVSKKRIDEVS